MNITELTRRVGTLLSTFKVPSNKLTDYYWLNKNIHIENNNHRDIGELKLLLVQILKFQNKERVETFVKNRKK